MTLEHPTALAASGEAETLEFEPMTFLNRRRGQVLLKLMAEEAR